MRLWVAIPPKILVDALAPNLSWAWYGGMDYYAHDQDAKMLQARIVLMEAGDYLFIFLVFD